MEAKKPYVIAIIIQMIYTGLVIMTKAAFDQGMNTFVYIFYRQAASSLLLLPIAFLLERKNVPPVSLWLLSKLFASALIGNTFSLNVYSVSMKFTSATLGSATYNTIPNHQSLPGHNCHQCRFCNRHYRSGTDSRSISAGSIWNWH
ncbi:hypothetical protein BAE44_0013807 [Dichanthelium oligosanthes]|uniref:WAT1-related protein n=1 Tax=Dichanthelium oligosanthes TaxID=888268 RepID=A0A1E5VJC7_9POAL|nr:hypothetical protein BAE44_0013807 [Dichanthelium oligosanthes]